MEEVHEDHLNLMKRCKKMENENKELKSRLNKLENKMLGNNIIMHGVQEETWELDETVKKRCTKQSPLLLMKKIVGSNIR